MILKQATNFIEESEAVSPQVQNFFSILLSRVFQRQSNIPFPAVNDKNITSQKGKKATSTDSFQRYSGNEQHHFHLYVLLAEYFKRESRVLSCKLNRGHEFAKNCLWRYFQASGTVYC